MLTGHANGEMTVSGTMDNPIVNGVLMGDSAFIRLPRYGSSLRLSEDPIKVNNNTIDFVNYKIYGFNDNPALLNGVVDFKSQLTTLKSMTCNYRQEHPILWKRTTSI